MVDIEEFLKETTELIANDKVTNIANSLTSYKTSVEYVKDVEFWKWMNENYKNSGIFDSADSIRTYIESGNGKANWLKLQLQGKGYEWDWMNKMKNSPKNMLKNYNAGIDPTQIGIDVTEKNIITGNIKTYQHKSYTGKTKLGSKALKNTPNDATIVTQYENTANLKSGGREVQGFQSKAEAAKLRDKRFSKASNGAANSKYLLKDVLEVTGSAALIGATIGCTVETIASYKKYKGGELSKKDYLIEIAKSGGNSGISAGVTAGIMIPIQSAIVAAGVSIPITIPIAIVVGSAVDKIVAPMFKKGEYLEILNDMKFYDDIGDGYLEFIEACEKSSNHFNNYLSRMKQEEEKYRYLDRIEKDVDESLLYLSKRFK